MKQCIFILFLLVFMTSCVVENEEIDYTYSIEKIWWSNNIDGNEDGYDQYRRLNFNIHLAEDAVRTVHARIYYKISGATSYSFYALSEEKEVAGSNTENNFVVPIGTPNKNLPKGEYDFSIEVYEQNSERLEASNGSVDSLVLVNNKIESPENDNSFLITVWWEGAYDFNNNGYYRHAKLVIDPDIEQNSSGTVSKNILVNLSYRLNGNEEYTLLNQFDETTITGAQPGDTLTYVIGKGNDIIGRSNFELPRGEYNFLVEIFDPNTRKLISFADYLTDHLNDIKFETKVDDSYKYTVVNPAWIESSVIDNDSDTYSAFRKLEFNINVDKDIEREVYAKLYINKDSVSVDDSSDFYLYDSSKTFSIFGSNASNTFSFDVGDILTNSSRSLDSNYYDFFISVFDKEREIDTVETYVGFLSDSTLAQQKFEKPEQDSATTK